MRKKNDLVKALALASNEKDVEGAWRSTISSFYGVPFSSPCGCDGVLSVENGVSLVAEFKFDLTPMAKTANLSSVVAQTIAYLHKFQAENIALPRVAVFGDKNEVTVLPVARLVGYLTKEYNWGLPPSSMGKDVKLVKDIMEDESLSSFVFDVSEGFKVEALFEAIRKANENINEELAITPERLPAAFAHWIGKVVVDGEMKEEEHIGLFLKCLTSPNDVYPHPKKRGWLVAGDTTVKINLESYRGFFNHYKSDHDPRELDFIIANKDRLMENMRRRRQGAFFTPEVWVAEAHRMLDKALGAGWRDEYVVWDCSAGTANLTRDYKFRELYISTLEQGDIDVIKTMKYNDGATVFRYDFLNQVDEELPEGLKAALKSGRKIVFLNNPPYAAATEFGANGQSKRLVAAETRMNKEMKADGVGASSQQLYAQFLYRICKTIRTYGLKGAAVATFSPALFVSGGSFAGLRRVIADSGLAVKDGMMFCADEFSAVSGVWGITFTVFARNGARHEVGNVLYTIKRTDDSGQVVADGTKMVYNLDGEVPASDWVREAVRGIKTQDAPQMANALVVKQEGYGALVDGALGYFLTKANSVYDNQTGVGLFSSCFSNGHGLSVLPDNFMRCVALFAARKLVVSTWMNDKDEYCVPNEAHPDYAQWNRDAVIYAIFHADSRQSSLRAINYKGKSWDILNQFFPFSEEQVRQLAIKHKNQAIYQDTKNHPGDRYLCKLISDPGFVLSPDAREILDNYWTLFQKAFALRGDLAAQKPEFHLDAWDAGWYQIRNGILKEQFTEEYKVLVEKFKAFEERMRGGVRRFGWLR